MTSRIDDIFDHLDIAAKKYPIKALAAEMYDKAESTLRNELTRQPGSKLGLITAIDIMRRTGDFSALDDIEAMFDRVAIKIEKPEGSKKEWLLHMAKIARESSHVVSNLAESMADGFLSANERKLCAKETYDAITALAALWHQLGEAGDLKVAAVKRANHYSPLQKTTPCPPLLRANNPLAPFGKGE